MKEQNKILLDQCRPFYDMLMKTQTMQGMSSYQLSELERVNSEEFHPGYRANLSCPPCVADFVKLVYRSYDAWIAVQPPPEPIIVAASFPVNDPPHPLEVFTKEELTPNRMINPEGFESVISKRAEKRKQDSLKRHGK